MSDRGELSHNALFLPGTPPTHSSCAEVRLNPTLQSHSQSIMKTFPYSNATIILVCGGHDTRFNIALRFNGEYLQIPMHENICFGVIYSQ